MAKVIAPNQQYSGLSATVMFVNGVGETDDLHLLEWFKSRGYTVEHTEPEKGENQDDIPIEKMTVAQLKEYAAKHEIDLGEATKKEDVLKVIQDAQQPKPSSEE